MITGIVGLNGSGKTTHLKKLHRTFPSAAFLPDNPAIPLELSAFELVWRVGKIHHITNAKEKAHKLVTTLLIDAPDTQPVATYSAGNYKKTALATLLIRNPSHLLLDEPLETVDAISTSIIMDMFTALSQQGRQLYISTQDLALTTTMDTVQVFSNMAIVAEGPPHEILGTDPFRTLYELSGVNITPVTMDWLQP